MSELKCEECGGVLSDGYACEKCDRRTVVCDDCHLIHKACPCGHCKEGSTWIESD